MRELKGKNAEMEERGRVERVEGSYIVSSEENEEGVRLSEGSFCRELMHVSCSNLAGAV